METFTRLLFMKTNFYVYFHDMCNSFEKIKAKSAKMNTPLNSQCVPWFVMY